MLEFIARVADHIPEPSQQMINYWGWYANAARGKRRKTGESGEASPKTGKEDPVNTFTRHDRLSWAKLIKRVYDFATARAIRRSLKLPTQEPEPLAHGPPHDIELLDQIA